jgi:hypothetical protein
VARSVNGLQPPRKAAGGRRAAVPIKLGKHAGIAATGQQEPPRNRVLAFLGPFLSAVTLARPGSKIQAGLPLLGSLCRRARLAPRVALFLSLVPEHPRRVMASVVPRHFAGETRWDCVYPPDNVLLL